MKILRSILLIIVFILVLGPSCRAQTKDLSEFVSANMDYKDGKYEAAIKKYEGILKSGEESGALYYNLGNSYFKTGKLGKAVLNYERAERFIPRDSDLNYNYKFAVSNLDNYAGNVQKKGLYNTVNDYLKRYTVGEIFLLANIVVAVAFMLYLLSIFLKFSSRINRVFIPLFLTLMFILSLSLFVKISNSAGKAVIITSTSANFEPRDDSTKHFDLPEGVKVKVVKDEFDWLKIKRLDGKLGWVKSDSLERIHLRKK